MHIHGFDTLAEAQAIGEASGMMARVNATDASFSPRP